MATRQTFWTEYQQALRRQGGYARSQLARQQRVRLGTDSSIIKKKEVDMEQQMTDTAIITQGNALIQAESPLDDYKLAVWAAYQGNKQITQNQLKALAVISHRYGLNPNPGLDLIYAWNQGDKFNIHISYKGWLALAHRFKQFVHRTERLPDEAAKARGAADGDIVVMCEVIDMDIVEKIKTLRDLGMDIDPNQFKLQGFGIWKKGTATPQGRDGEWVAKKRAVKDAMVQLVADSFNIAPPPIDGVYYDHDNDTYVMDIENDVEMAARLSTEKIIVDPQPTPSPDDDDTPPEPPAKAAALLITPRQISAIHALAKRLYGKDGTADVIASYKAKYRVSSTKDLTVIQAGEVIDELQAMVDEKQESADTPPEPVAEEAES